MTEYSGFPDRRRDGNATLIEWFERRFEKLESNLQNRLDKVGEKLDEADRQRLAWEKGIEARLALLEQDIKLVKSQMSLIRWISASVASVFIAGMLTFGGLLLANKIDIVEHAANPPTPIVVVVTPTPHP